MNKKKWKLGGWIVSALLIVVVIFLLIPIPVSYNLDAMEFQVNNLAYQEPCTLTVDGTYHVNLFTDSVFKGKVILSGHPSVDIMKEYETELVFDKENGASYEYRVRDQKEEGDVDDNWCPVGYMAQSGFMKNPCIAISLDENGEKVAGWTKESSWGTENGYFVVTGTEDYEKAIRILAEYSFIDR